MAIAASISSDEVAAQILGRFGGKYCEALLINSPGTTYQPGVTDQTSFLSNEVTAGLGGYHRESFGYDAGVATSYEEEGIALPTKATVFEHDGSADVIDFTHVALVWGSGQVVTITPGADPTNLIDGTYTNLPTQGSATGVGFTVDVTVSGGAITSVDITNVGSDYVAADVVLVLEADMVSAGMMTVGGGNLSITIDTVSVNADSGNIIGVVETTNAVSLTAGNQAIFYWNTKLYGNN